MLSRDALVQMNQESAEEMVLSVYLNGEETDPAQRNAWRLRLNALLKELQEHVEGNTADEKRDYEAALEIIEKELDELSGMIPGRGWVGFATADRLLYAESVPVPMPDLVRWEYGVHVAPYLRALKQTRPVYAVFADRMRGRIFRYVLGELTEEEEVVSVAAIDTIEPGTAKRASTHSGGRGEAGADALQESTEVATRRLVREIADKLLTAQRDGHLLVIAGKNEIIAAIRRELPDRVAERSIDVPGARVQASTAEVTEVIENAASALSLQIQKRLVEEILEINHADGRACVGQERTARALEAGAVDILLVSRAFSRAQPDVAEELVDQAFDQGGTVLEIAEEVAGELDAAGGIGARLRFTV